MAVQHGNFVKSARRGIAKNGRSITIRSFVKSGDAYNPTLTPTDTTVIGLFSKIDIFKIRDGSLVKATDQEVLIDADFTIDEKMKVVDGGKVYEIVDINPLKLGETLIMYTLIIRG